MLFTYQYYSEVNKDFQKLSNELDMELETKNGDKQKEYSKYNKLDNIKDIIIAFDNDKPIGCGSIKHYDNKRYEVKRVYIQKQYRGNGISKEIMKKLEDVAKQKGVHALILETGKQFIAAVSLYKSLGYKEIENYGQYKNMDSSICMEKTIN